MRTLKLFLGTAAELQNDIGRQDTIKLWPYVSESKLKVTINQICMFSSLEIQPF